MNRVLIGLLVSAAACSLTNNNPVVQPERTTTPPAAPAQAAPAVAAPTAAPEAHAEAPGAHAGCGGNCNGNCGSQQPPPAQQGVGQRLGAPINAGPLTALADVLANPGRFSGQTILTEGTVSAVCQAAGCWMRLVDANNQQIHVRMHGHSFFIPRNATGRRARVQATVLGGVPNGHCEQEANGQTGQRARLELDALGVELQS